MGKGFVAAAVIAIVIPCAQAACAQDRLPEESRATASKAATAVRKKTTLPHAPHPEQKSWMDRASGPSNGGGGGGM